MKRISAIFMGIMLTFCSVFISESVNLSEPVQADSETVYTIEDIKNLQDFLLCRETPDLSGKDYDLCEDGVWNVFDLCLMKQQYLKYSQYNNDTLVAYFSCTNNTEQIAEYISDTTGGDLFEIEPVVPYTDADLNYNSDCRANREQNDETARPEIANSVENFEQYDIVYLGYPIWWGEEPRIIDTFLESYNFSDVTVVPFCTSGSSGISTSERNIANLVTIGNQLEGKRFNSSATKESVGEWVKEKQSEMAEIQNNNAQYTFIKGGTFLMGSPESEPELSIR